MRRIFLGLFLVGVIAFDGAISQADLSCPPGFQLVKTCSAPASWGQKVNRLNICTLTSNPSAITMVFGLRDGQTVTEQMKGSGDDPYNLGDDPMFTPVNPGDPYLVFIDVSGLNQTAHVMVPDPNFGDRNIANLTCQS